MTKKAYIVASSKTVQNFINDECKKHHIQTTLAKNTDGIIENLKEQQPQLLFIQSNILEENKNSIIKTIKLDPILSKIYVVIFQPKSGDTTTANQFGADAIMAIPFDPENLIAIFQKGLNLPQKILLVGFSKEEPLHEMLHKTGYHIVQTLKGADALSIAESDFPSLIITNQTLSDMSGDTFVTQLSTNKAISNIPVFVTSSSFEVSIIEKIFESGAKEILLSPFESAENLKTITDFIAPPHKGRQKKALVVDDSPTIRNLISQMFKQLGYDVYTAENGFEGFKAVQKHEPDIITSDYDMPILNGWEFCIEVRKSEKYKNIPIIMVTTRASELDIKKGFLLGVSAYLPKPFKINDLKKAVKEAIDEAKRLKERAIIAKYVAADTIKSVEDEVDGIKNFATEEKHITVLFSDICKFSSKCERFSAKKIVTLLNAYFDLMVEVLHQNNAIIDKFIGDAIVARFDSGDPKQDALNAAKSALGMLKKLNEFNETAMEEVHIRIGINSGNVIMGNLGSEKYRLEYAMIGDNVNVGQRLESSAPKQGCLISKSTYDLIKPYVKVDKLQKIEVKGKTQKVAAHELLGLI